MEASGSSVEFVFVSVSCWMVALDTAVDVVCCRSICRACQQSAGAKASKCGCFSLHRLKSSKGLYDFDDYGDYAVSEVSTMTSAKYFLI